VSAAKAAASPFSHPVGGRAFTITPPTFAMFGRFERWAEDDLARQAVVAGADVARIPRGPKAMRALFETTRGKMQFAYMCAVASEPALTFPEFEACFSDTGEVEALIDKALDAASPPAKGAPPAGEAF
jgi:hypothetical protein